MSTPFVALNRPDVPWTRPDQSLLIGKDILELLSSSMYVDPMALFREYIQNAADSIDLARTAGVANVGGLITIRIDANERTVIIRDDGAGLSHAEFGGRLTALGGSKKRGTQARGFRGVGRLAGLAYARELYFRSRQAGERSVHELRWSARDVREMMRSSEPRDLAGIVRDSVHTREISGHEWPERFFEVELRGVVRHRNDRILNRDLVRDYLAQTAPVPFHPDFQHADAIASALKQYGIAVGAVEIEVDGHGRIYRPHRNSVAVGKGLQTEFKEFTVITTEGRDRNVAAVTWILHSDYRGALPQSSLIDGWRYRVGDVQIGDNDLNVPLFSEPRFNSWCVAETHVLDSRILPNGRRDHFEQNAYFNDLVSHLAPKAIEISQRCRTSSIYRNLVRHIETGLSAIDLTLAALKKRVRVDGSGDKIAQHVVRELDRLQRLAARSIVGPDKQKEYQLKLARLNSRLAAIEKQAATGSILKGFSPAQQTILSEVLRSIYTGDNDLQRAQLLVDRILKRVRKAVKGRR